MRKVTTSTLFRRQAQQSHRPRGRTDDASQPSTSRQSSVRSTRTCSVPDPLELSTFESSDEDGQAYVPEDEGIESNFAPASAIMGESIINKSGYSIHQRDQIANCQKHDYSVQASCDRCQNIGYDHDPDVCVAARLARKPEIIAKITDWRRPWDVAPSTKLNLHKITFADPSTVHFKDSHIALPLKSEIEVTLETFKREAAEQYRRANTFIRTWPASPPNYNVETVARRNVARAGMRVETKCREKQELASYFAVYLEARELIEMFFSKVQTFETDGLKEIPKMESIPRREWFGNDIVGAGMTGRGQRLHIITRMRDLLFSADPNVITATKFTLASELEISEFSRAGHDPLATFEEWLVRAGVTAEDIMRLFFGLTSDGKPRAHGDLKCVHCQHPATLTDAGQLHHDMKCPVSVYIRDRWKYGSGAVSTVPRSKWLTILEATKRRIFKERLADGRERVITSTVGTGEVFSIRDVRKPKPPSFENRSYDNG